MNQARAKLELCPAARVFLSWCENTSKIPKNEGDQVLRARDTEHPTQTLIFTKTAGRNNLVEVIVI